MCSPGLGTTTAVIASLQRGCGRPTPTTSGPPRVGGVHSLLHLYRGDVLPTGLDHVLVAVGEPEHAVLAEPADVAGVEPAVLEGGGRGLGVAQIAGHRARSAVYDLALRAGGEQRTVRGHDGHLHAGDRRPH